MRRRPENLTAYDFYLRAMQKYYLSTREELAEGLRLAHRALELDPRFGLAAALASVRHMHNLTWGYAIVLNLTARKQFGFFAWH
jgi:adenylate cyclase